MSSDQFVPITSEGPIHPVGKKMTERRDIKNLRLYRHCFKYSYGVTQSEDINLDCRPLNRVFLDGT